MKLEKLNKLFTALIIIITTIVMGVILAGSVGIDWYIQTQYPKYHSGEMLYYNQYLIDGTYISSDNRNAWIYVDSTYLKINLTAQNHSQFYKICQHHVGDHIKYATFFVGELGMTTDIQLRREVC